MDIIHLLQDIFTWFFLIYGLIVFISYIVIGIFSSFQLPFYVKKNSYFNFNSISEFKNIPSVSIIAPCYNEENSIVENIKSLLHLNYPKVDVIIINDGSTDNSLNLAIENFDLVKVDIAFEQTLNTAPVRGIYKSKINAYSNLIVIDKENGGKADALNAGMNLSKNDLFLAVDVDCIIEQDAIFRMVKPFIEEESGKVVIASGGVIRIANSCEVENGNITKVNYPKNFWARFQVMEYFRAFTLSRVAWSKIDGLLIISGAFGMFDRKIAMNARGYDVKTVGEDLELVVRMRKYMHNVVKKKHSVAFIPDPLCWTEVPETFKTLSQQRNRWTRGSIYTVLKHKDMFLNPKYGKIGLISFPYWVLFEWLAPIIETIGIVFFVIMIIFGEINTDVFILLSIMIFVFSVFYSTVAVFYETYIFNRYKGFKFLYKVFFIGILEFLIFHPMNLKFALAGNLDYFFRKNKKSWGKMDKTGFNKTTT